MEKINTPLQTAQQLIEKEHGNGHDKTELYDRGYMAGLNKALEIIESLLPKEMETIIDNAQEYKSYCFQCATFPDSARTYFTKKFEVKSDLTNI